MPGGVNEMARAGIGWALLAAAAIGASAAPAADPPWRPVASGVDYAIFELSRPCDAGDRRLHVVRIDPRRASLRTAMAAQRDGMPRTAARWCRDAGLCVAINMGMFAMDGRTNVGYARAGTYVHQPTWSPSYRSVLAFGPAGVDSPVAEILDLDAPSVRATVERYTTVVQNL